MISVNITSNQPDIGFAIEPQDHRVRLILLQANKELACRKETTKRLQSFIDTDNETAFKGRLRLLTMDKQVAVYFKQTLVGHVNKEDFISILKNESK